MNNNRIITLSTFRKDNRIFCTSDDLYNDLVEFWDNSDYIARDLYGFMDDDVNTIFNTMEMISCMYGKAYNVRYHMLIVSFDINTFSQDHAWNILEQILLYIGASYTSLMTMGFNDDATYIEGRFFINATNHIDGSKFRDNNSFYKDLAKKLSSLTNCDVRLNHNIFFGSESNS